MKASKNTTVTWNQVRDILDAVLQVPPEERSHYLDQACPQPELRRYVESLVVCYDKADEFLERPAVHESAKLWSEAEAADLWIGRRIGPYRIEEQIGKGGMGAVFRGVRADDEYQKQVAIKLVKEGFGSSFALARFKVERQILAGLEHPNIARLLDGGRTEEGFPYLVMELIKGMPIDEYCDVHNLSITERLKVFRTVCSAVQYAHENFVIHRDLKPANIMITDGGVPKLLDFGIAKILTPSPPGELEITVTTGGMMTPEYASPEQVRNEAITTASDVYSLGVVLYVLLTGHHPYRLRGLSLHEVAQVICDADPVRPSNAVTHEEEVTIPVGQPLRQTPETISGVRDGHPETLRRLLSGDLDNIVLKALNKEPRRRYGSIEEFSSDIQHYLDGLPVRARKNSIAYRLGKFVRRNRAVVVPSSLLLLTILALVAVVAGFFLYRARRAPVASRSEWVQVTNFADWATAPALSSDGRMITFIRGPETFVTPGQIYVKLLPDGQPVQLTHDNLTKMAPTLSPDGSRIAYTATDASGGWNTWVVPVLGGESQETLKNAAALTWIDRGQVLFSEIKTGVRMAIVTAAESRAGERDVYVPANEDGMAHRSWLSPDGKWVLVSEMDKTGWMPCRIVPFDGSSAGEIAGPHRGSCTYAGWSPDGSRMYFSVDVGDGFHLWRQRFPKGVPEQITFGPTEEEGVAVAQDGKSLVASVGIRQASVWLHDARGDRQISSEGFAGLPGLGYGGRGSRSVFSPDGKKLFYLARKEGSRAWYSGELWMADLESGRTELVVAGVLMNDFDLAPDGKRVAFSSFNDKSNSRVWVAPLDHSAAPQQVASFESDQASFGLSGELFFRGMEDKSEFIYVVEQNDVNTRKLSPSAAHGFKVVSPDGKWWVSNLFYSMAQPTGGGPTIRICDFCDVGWGPGGKYLYVRLRGMGAMGGGRVYVIALPAGNSLPTLPPGGIKSAKDLKGLNVVAVIDMAGKSVFAPGRNPATYAYTRMTVQRNLFRIPLD